MGLEKRIVIRAEDGAVIEEIKIGSYAVKRRRLTGERLEAFLARQKEGLSGEVYREAGAPAPAPVSPPAAEPEAPELPAEAPAPPTKKPAPKRAPKRKTKAEVGGPEE